MSLKPTVPNLINRNKPVTEQVSEMVADSEDTSKNDNTMYKAAGFVLVQGTSSVSLIILNKYLATFFNFPVLTLVLQNTIATSLSILVWALGIGPTMQPWKMQHFVKVMPMSALFTILLYTSFLTMGHLSIATVVVFRNAGPLLTAVGENHIRGEQFTKNSLMALMMMIVGATIYGFNDLHFDAVGYMWATFNLVCNTCAGLFGKHLSMDLKTEQSGLGLACYQNIVSVPMFIFVGILTGESGRWAELGSHSEAVPYKVWMAGLVSCLACVTMGVSTFELQRLVAQATVAVANVSYKLVTLIVGAVVYGNNVGLLGLLGLVIAQASAILYVYEKQYGEKSGKKPTNTAGDSSSSSKADSPRLPSGEESVQLLQRGKAVEAREEV